MAQKSEVAQTKFFLRPKFIIGTVTIVAMLLGLANGISFQDAGVFGIGVGASIQLIFS